MKTPLLAALLLLASVATAQGFDPANYSSLKWVNVGPDRGGRSVACTGVRTRPNEFYFGATGGGLWKTDNAGTSWTCVTDGFLGSSSVGAVAVSDSSPDVVYIGTGERDIRGDISEGDGLYRSADAGKTWTRAGLEETRTISRVVVDPKDPNTVYVAALGHVYGPNPDRGVFKSTDGGKSWRKVLFESERAGAVDLVMDPTNSKVLYAATWEAWRTPYHLNSGGPGSKLWKSTDAGETWTDLTNRPGMPAAPIGKIGISVSAANPQRVWAIVESHEGGIFRSDDGGQTWSKVSDANRFRQRAWYFSHVYADPKKADTVYCLNVGAFRSNDNGKTWSSVRVSHGDNHDLWISPDDPQRLIEANDGGASVSTDGGQTWTRESYPTAQIYHVVADNHVPYRIYGEQQDNSAVRVSPSEPNRPNRLNWEPTAGGESGYLAVNPSIPDLVYGGNYNGEIEELDYRTSLSRNINPWPDNPMGHAAADLKHRIQWTFPIVFSPNDSNVLYTASQYLLRTTDRGQSWSEISPDLTRNDKSKQVSSGGPITQDNTSVEYYDTIFTVAESPRRRGVIWCGSDDGLVHLTRDGGGSWDDVTPSGLPTWARVSMIEASPHDAGTAYLAANNYENEDTAPYIFKTHDYGRSWKKITVGIPATAFARVCREDLHRAGLLYAGTEIGAFVSFDDGDHWQTLQENLPVCPVHDLCLKDDDLIAATHGRLFWIMHGVSRLGELTAGKLAVPTLYPTPPRMREENNVASIDYYLPAAAKDVSIVVTDRSGAEVGHGKGSTEPGVHTSRIELGHPPFGSFPGMIMWAGGPRTIPVPPGDYRVRLDVDGVKSSQTLQLFRDPRVPASDRDLQDQYAFSVEVSNRVNEANQAVVRIRDMREQIHKALSSPGLDPAATDQGHRLVDALTAIEGEIYQYRSHSGEDPLNYPVKLNDKLAGVLSTVQSGQFRPTRQAREVYAELSKELDVQFAALRDLESGPLGRLNGVLKGRGVPVVVPKNPPLRVGGGGFEEGEKRAEGGS